MKAGSQVARGQRQLRRYIWDVMYLDSFSDSDSDSDLDSNSDSDLDACFNL